MDSTNLPPHNPPDTPSLSTTEEQSRESATSTGDPQPPSRKKGGLKRLGKKLLFSFIVTVCVLLLLEGLLTAIGVKPIFYEDPFVGFASYSPLFEEVTQDDGTTSYQTSPGKLRWFNQQSFPKVKGDDTYRIVCLGGSTTMGRPYDDKTSFSRWLREFLKEADPHRKYEVINAGGVSYASYRVANLMSELVQYEPDLFIVYTGHNEFLEQHTYSSILEVPESVRTLSSLLSRTRIYSVTHRLVNRTSQEDSNSGQTDKSVLPADVDAVLDRTLGPETYVRDATFHSQVISHFENTLVRITEIARHAGADVLIVEPASNLLDCQPFKSQHRSSLSQEELAAWNQYFSKGQAALEAEQLETALASFDQALRIDDRMAHLHYLRGQVLWKLERFDEARAALIQARDEDVCPLRVLTPMRQMTRDVSREQNVPLVPFATVVESRSPHALPGNDFFLDHVHPTIEGHQLLADLILEKLTEIDVVRPAPEWNESARQNVIKRVEATFDPRDHALALRNLSKVLTWSGKFAEADRLALRAVVELQDDPEAHFLAGNAELRQDRHGEAIAHFEKTIQLDPGYIKAYNNLGNEYFQLGELGRAAEYFEQAIRADPQFVLGFHNLGVVHFESGQVDAAIGYLDKALALEPDRFDSHWLLSKIYYEQKRYADATHHMQRAVEIRPYDEGARSDLEMLSKLIE